MDGGAILVMVFDKRGVSSLEAWPPTAAGAEGVGEGPNEEPGHPLGSASCMRSIGSDASSSDVDLSLDPIKQLGNFNIIALLHHEIPFIM